MESLEQSMARKERAKRRRMLREEPVPNPTPTSLNGVSAASANGSVTSHGSDLDTDHQDGDMPETEEEEEERAYRGSRAIKLAVSTNTLQERMRKMFQKCYTCNQEHESHSLYDLFEAFTHGESEYVESVEVAVTNNTNVTPRQRKNKKSLPQRLTDDRQAVDELKMRKISLLPCAISKCTASKTEKKRLEIAAPSFRLLNDSDSYNNSVNAKFRELVQSSSKKSHYLRYSGGMVDGEKLHFTCPKDPLYFDDKKSIKLPTTSVSVEPSVRRPQTSHHRVSSRSSAAAYQPIPSREGFPFGNMRRRLVSCGVLTNDWMPGERKLFWSLVRMLGGELALIHQFMSGTKSVQQLRREYDLRKQKDSSLGIMPRWEGIGVTDNLVSNSSSNNDANHQEKVDRVPDWYHPLQSEPSWWFKICEAPNFEELLKNSKSTDGLDDLDRAFCQCLVDSSKLHGVPAIQELMTKKVFLGEELTSGADAKISNADDDRGLQHLEDDQLSRIRPFTKSRVIDLRNLSFRTEGLPPAEMFLHSLLGKNIHTAASVFNVSLPPIVDYNHRDLNECAELDWTNRRVEIPSLQAQFTHEFDTIHRRLKIIRRAAVQAGWVLSRVTCPSCQQRGRAGTVSVKDINIPQSYANKVSDRASLMCHPAILEVLRSSSRRECELYPSNVLNVERLRQSICSYASRSFDKLPGESPKCAGGWTNALLNRFATAVHDLCKDRVLSQIDREYPLSTRFWDAEREVTGPIGTHPLSTFAIIDPASDRKLPMSVWLLSAEYTRTELERKSASLLDVDHPLVWIDNSAEKVSLKEGDLCLLYNDDGLLALGIIYSFKMTMHSTDRAGKSSRLSLAFETENLTIELVWIAPANVPREFLLRIATLRKKASKFKKQALLAILLTSSEIQAIEDTVATLYPTIRNWLSNIHGGSSSRGSVRHGTAINRTFSQTASSEKSLAQRAIDFVKYSFGMHLPSQPTGHSIKSSKNMALFNEDAKTERPNGTQISQIDAVPTIFRGEPSRCCSQVGVPRKASANDTNLWCCFCNTCSGDSLSVLCDCCDRSFHLDCLSPKLKRAPKGKWYCPDCKDSPATFSKTKELQKKLLVQEIRFHVKQLLEQQVERVVSMLHDAVKKVKCRTDSTPEQIAQMDRLHSGASFHLDRFWHHIMKASSQIYLTEEDSDKGDS